MERGDEADTMAIGESERFNISDASEISGCKAEEEFYIKSALARSKIASAILRFPRKPHT